MAVYSGSKAALECMTRHWARELAKPYRMTVNIVAIGIVETHHLEDMEQDERERLIVLPTAERRLGTTDDVAQVISFLASDSARWINGDTLSVNGGSMFL